MKMKKENNMSTKQDVKEEGKVVQMIKILDKMKDKDCKFTGTKTRKNINPKLALLIHY